MSDLPVLRFLDDEALAGPVNMARDEALLEAVGACRSKPTIRFYEWSEPTVSLGYFQHYQDFASMDEPIRSLSVVRRLTGGGAILHDRELTYSLAIPLDHALLRGGPNRLYEVLHDAVIGALASLGATAHRGGEDDGSGAAKGPFFCFARRHRYDVLIGSDKVAGSAQRRTRAAVLQHGSIILERRFVEQPAADLSTHGVQSATLRRALRESLVEVAGVELRAGVWTTAELAAADALVAKYAGAEWVGRR